MMTTRSTGRKPAAKAAAAHQDTASASHVVSVDTVEPHAVFHDGEQRTGTLTGVPADTAQYWIRHGWATPHTGTGTGT